MLFPNYFFWIGTIYLIILTWQDYKRKMWIDDRLNYFMMGISFSLLSHVNRAWWYVLAIIALFYTLAFFLNRYKLIGGGDVNSLLWIYYGTAIITPVYAIWFTVIFIALTLLYIGLKVGLFKNRNKSPFFAVLLISFVLLAFFAHGF